MILKRMLFVLVCALALLTLAACQETTTSISAVATQIATSTSGATTSGATTSGATTTDTPATSATDTTETTTTTTTTEATAEVVQVADTQTTHGDTHDSAEDYTYDTAAAIAITLNGDAIAADSAAVTVNGSTATITAAGTYSLSGSLADGQIIVDTEDEATVQLILNGVDIHSSTSAPIYILKAEEVGIILADGTTNTLTDGESYVFASADETEPNATLFANADLTIFGNGSLTVTGSYNDAISSDDGLIIAGGTITVSAADDGIRGKDYLVVKDGQITVESQGDGLKSDNDEDATQGYIAIEGGVITVTAGGDAIAAETDVLISGGQFALVAGGGSGSVIGEEDSAKGIKGLANVSIDGGTFTIDSADDAIHSNGNITINGGTFTLTSGDDGVHADATLTINGGDIQVPTSYEGIESAVISINAGNVYVTASDDGINVAGGADGSGMMAGPGRGGRRGQPAAQTETFSYTGSQYLYIHGGYVVVSSGGDGIDVNGAIEMTDGVVLVSGPTDSGNGALDYDGGFNLTGGYIVAAGSAGMAQSAGSASGQNSVLINLSGQSAGTLIHIQNSAGEDVLTFAPGKEYQSVAFSSAALVTGETYTVYTGGSSTGTATDGLYQGGSYTPGTEVASFTVSSTVTTVGNGNFR
ncbi:carbohydrate-binding domain-containing protein [Promineifilum sp.]|uniref:carbohydrate-binding domain-containing protein n=1 Tax=Promineifilum sp. TaxID=2664178 RepID=UPI0035B16C36